MLLCMQLEPSPFSFAQKAGASSSWQHQLNLLLDSTGEGIFCIDLDGHCVFINRAGASMLGWDAAANTTLADRVNVVLSGKFLPYKQY